MSINRHRFAPVADVSDPGSDEIALTRPTVIGTEIEAVRAAATRRTLNGDGHFTKSCESWFTTELDCRAAYLVPSCSAALDLAATIVGIGPGDEVIMPSFTFVATATAFALRGARIVFVDVKPGTMNIDETRIEAAVTPRTRAIVPVHYAGAPCEMDVICDIAERHDLLVIEDAAQALGARFKGRPVGSFGALAAFSFHDTKNITSGGEGGLLAVNDPALAARAAIQRDRGTNRQAFLAGEVLAYSWVDIGGSYFMNEISAAWLWAQLSAWPEILQARLKRHARYRTAFAPLVAAGAIEAQDLPCGRTHNGHIFFFKLRDSAQRAAFMAHMAQQGIQTAFHYVPLHGSAAGQRFGTFHGPDRVTSRDAARLVRLPMHHALGPLQQARVIRAVFDFFPEVRP